MAGSAGGGSRRDASRASSSLASAAGTGVKVALQACGVAYGTLLAAAFVGQRRMMYFPDPSPPRDPVELGAPGCAQWEAVTRDGNRVQGWFWPARDRAGNDGDAPGAGARLGATAVSSPEAASSSSSSSSAAAAADRLTVLLLHGNAGNRAHRLGWMSLMLYHLKVNVCIVDYRGYGGSTGSPTEAGMRLDGVAAVEWLVSAGHVRDVRRDVVFWGESIGTAVAIAVAEEHAPLAFIHQAGMNSIAEVAQSHLPLVLPRLLLLDKWNSSARLRRLAKVWRARGASIPSLSIHGTRDSIVPLHFGEALYESLPEPKRFYRIPGADHNDIEMVGGARYWEEIKAFLREVKAQRPPKT